MNDRHSEEVGKLELITDPEQLARAEAFNALQQYDAGIALLGRWLSEGGQPRLRPSDILSLNRILLIGINSGAGQYRNKEIKISNSMHIPPSAELVPAYVEEFCDYINKNWKSKSAIHLAAYALWRINWIHPFSDGNGRTARIISYILLCASLGYQLPGENTIPEQIAADKRPYYSVLEAADENFKQGDVDLDGLEEFLSELLANQLLSIHDNASMDVAVEDIKSEVSDRGFLTFDPIENAERLTVYLAQKKPEDSANNKNIIERNPVTSTGVFLIIATIIGSIITALY